MSELFPETKTPSGNKKATLYTDGGSRGNPGPAASGGVLYDSEKKELAHFGYDCGTATNNHAEYMSLIEGMKLALKHDITDLAVRMDSKLVIEQMCGRWKVKHPALRPIFEQAKILESQFASVEYRHVPREQNAAADRIVNQVLDGQYVC